MAFELSRLIMNLLKHTKPIEAEFDALRREIRSNNISFQKKVDQLQQSNIETERSLSNSLNTSINTVIADQQVINDTLSDQIQTIIATPDDPPPTEYYVPITGAFIIGDGLTEGDWKIIVDGTKLQFQRLESSVWTVKGEFA